MKVVICGGSGLVGSAVRRLLTEKGYEVVVLTRANPAGQPGLAAWDPSRGTVNRAALRGAKALIHLAGEPILGWWTEAKKKRIRTSRVEGTRLLSEVLATMTGGPRILISASAIGVYGAKTKGIVDEESALPPVRPDDFLASVAREWEEATRPAEEAGVRVVHARLGIVLSRRGGALGAMLPPFWLGLGGPIGKGAQWMSWIAVQDAARAIVYAMEQDTLSGPLNLVAPQPVTNREFSKALGRALRRPALLPVPPFAIKLLFGRECAEATVLQSLQVKPKRLTDAGFCFEASEIEQGLRMALADPK